MILAGYEDSLHPQSWRNTNGATTRYLGFLADHGYELSDVERLAGGMTTDDTAGG